MCDLDKSDESAFILRPTIEELLTPDRLKRLRESEFEKCCGEKSADYESPDCDHKKRFLCPISSCPYSRVDRFFSSKRGLKQHFLRVHAEKKNLFVLTIRKNIDSH